ncbi:WHG domain-containing protein [Burkholderia sp. Bp8963]|uniref:TetR-like C-terminal domain-containing protein n=1 Tax=Burkholderia sp. Bp8963 TaxID=2184547 RepID=UPI000F59862B|nr:TetR-like C-terminal domain-containing protein [Burkholderia sp. Bp8963]RQS62925.1 WHG domain-containing protein [Burkholderia sp. Bp8963]
MNGLAYVKFAHAYAELFRLMYGGFAVQHKDNAELVQARRENSEVTTEAIRRMIGSAVDEKQILAFSVAVRSFVHGFAVLWIDSHLESSESDIEALAESAFEFSMHAFPDMDRLQRKAASSPKRAD